MSRPRSLTDEAVDEIIAACKLRDEVLRSCSAKALSKRYGVCRGIIHRISAHGRNYRMTYADAERAAEVADGAK